MHQSLNHKRPLAAAMITLLAGVGVAVGLLASALGAAPATAQRGPTRVVADAVIRETIGQTASVLGRIVTNEGGDVAAQTSGPVDRVLVVVGDRVRQNQVLAELDLEEVRLQLAQAQADVRVAEAQREAAEANVAKARQLFERARQLRNSAAFSQARLDDSERDVQALRAATVVAEATIAQRQAAVERIAVDLDRALIRAPYAGVITERRVNAGDYANEGEALFTMINTTALEVEADVASNNLAALDPGFTIRGELEDGSEILTMVRAVVPVENPLTRTRAVRFSLSRVPTVELAIGQSVTLAVPVDAPRPALTVDKDAIVGGDTVFLVVDGVAQPRQVQLGQALGNRFEVLGGLREGDLVVVRGNERLRPGEPIEAEQQTRRVTSGETAVAAASAQPLQLAADTRRAADTQRAAVSPGGQPLPPASPK